VTDLPELRNQVPRKSSAAGGKGFLAGATILLLGLCVLPVYLCASAAGQSQAPAAPAPQPQGTEGKPVERLQFSSDAAVVTYFVRPGALNEFRKITRDWRDKAVASPDPQIAQQLRGWKLYQAAEGGPRDSVVLMSVIYPVIQGADYTLPVDRNFSGSPSSGSETLVGLSRNELTLVEDFGKGVPQPSPAGASAPPAPPPSESPFVFSSDAAVLTLFVKGERVPAFEQVVRRVHEGLVASRRPIRLEQAAGWRLFRSKEQGPNGTVLYLSLIAPVVKGAEYSVAHLLQEAYPQEAPQLLPLYRDALAGLSRTELRLLEDFGAPPVAGVSERQVHAH
jgi:hypothetical protein